MPYDVGLAPSEFLLVPNIKKNDVGNNFWLQLTNTLILNVSKTESKKF